jgi:hypothetical protein
MIEWPRIPLNSCLNSPDKGEVVVFIPSLGRVYNYKQIPILQTRPYMLTIKLLDIVIGKFYTLIKRVPNI